MPRHILRYLINTRSSLVVVAALMGLVGAVAVAAAKSPTPSSQILIAPTKTVPNTYFGMHIHHADRGTPWPSIPFGSWRLWDAGVAWASLQPRRGEWDFSRLDKYLAMARLTGVEVLLPLGLTPRWASARPDELSSYGPGNAAEPRDLGDWRTYVRAVAERYKGRVTYYELWNEPNAKGFYSGTPETLVTMGCEAKNIIQAIDPKAKLAGPAVTGDGRHLDWLDRFFQAGGANCLDIISYHFYVAHAQPEAMLPLIEKVRKVMAKHDLGIKPLWNTEAGWWIANSDTTPPLGVAPGWKMLDGDTAANFVARALVLGWAAGLDRYYWYAWDNKGLGLVEPGDKAPKPAALAFRQAVQWLADHQLRQCREDNGFWSCELADEHGARTWLVWRSNEPSRKWQAPTAWRIAAYEPLLGGQSQWPEDGIAIGARPVRLLSQDAVSKQ